jgi:hypothetical protein
MPVIRVDAQVWSWLKTKAQPFEDTPNSVLRRIAELDEQAIDASPTVGRPARHVERRRLGNKTPQGEYRVPILHILSKQNGRADRAFVLKQLEKVMADRLTSHDRKDIKSGTIRWQKSAEWEVSTMRQEGLLLPRVQSPHGVWCLSSQGQRAALATRTRSPE